MEKNIKVYQAHLCKIGFLWKRGNIEAENRQLFAPLSVEAELQDTDLYNLCKIYERVMSRPKKKKEKKQTLKPGQQITFL